MIDDNLRAEAKEAKLRDQEVKETLKWGKENDTNDQMFFEFEKLCQENSFDLGIEVSNVEETQ